MKPTKIQTQGTRIPPPQPPEEAELLFSFKLLDIHTNNKVGLHHCGEGYMEKLLIRFQDVNRMRIRDFRGLPTKQLRNHPIKFEETSEPNGFQTLNEQLRDQEPWQFQLTRGEHGRIHGILIDETFYVIWLDPCHRLYDDGSCQHV